MINLSKTLGGSGASGGSINSFKIDTLVGNGLQAITSPTSLTGVFPLTTTYSMIEITAATDKYIWIYDWRDTSGSFKYDYLEVDGEVLYDASLVAGNSYSTFSSASTAQNQMYEHVIGRVCKSFKMRSALVSGSGNALIGWADVSEL